ncbi:iron-sulfur cluster assembly scaffold protein, partial [bacterium]|nr:iron-sulfur cluster assembly scaffold protein [bacterium]
MKPYYSKKVIKYSKNPKNLGKIKRASGVGEYKSPICGDVTTFYIKVKDSKISDIKFITLGCA